MRNLIFILVILLTVSCSKQEIEGTKLSYAFEPSQPIMIDVEIIPTEDIELNFDDMLREVNADYFNRYGIGVNLILRDRQKLSESVKHNNEILLPQHLEREPKKLISVYIIPREYLYFEGANGYSVVQSRSIILNENAQVQRTLAHEIGHVLGLDHTNLDNNIMSHLNYSTQYTEPENFTQEQIDTIIENIDPLSN